MLFPHLCFIFSAISCVLAVNSHLTPRAQCGTEYEPCSAEGSTSGKLPAVGDEMRDLYEDIIDSLQGAQWAKRDATPWDARDRAKRADGTELCCASGMQCLLLQGLKISFCWDRFTTQYHFPDGSYGSVTTGLYNTASNDVVDLIVGNYTLAGGETGNIYAGEEDSRPNISTMERPTPWTSEGVGSAIPGSELGAPATEVSTIEGTTRADSTVPATTIPETTMSGSVVVPATTIPPSTIPGETQGPVTVTITRDGAEAPTTTAGCPALAPSLTRGLTAGILMLMTALYGLS